MGTPYYPTAQALAVKEGTITGLSDFDGTATRLEFTECDLRQIETHVDPLGIRGSRSRSKEGVRIGAKRSSGRLVMYPRPDELDVLLPWILGADESTDTFALAESLQEWGLLIDRGLRRFVYTGCKVGRATFECSQGEMLKLTLDIEAETEVVSSSSFPGTIPALTTLAPYVFSDATLSLSADASATEFRSVSIVIDNMLDADRQMNSVTRSQILATDRLVTVQMSLPYTTDEVDIYAQSIDGAAGTVTWTNGNRSIAFAFANLKSTNETPVAQGRTAEIMQSLNMVAYKSSTTNELIVTNDSSG